jgi:3-deoxy-7-phosphoheptulonate synthase
MYTNSRIKTFSELPTPKDVISKYDIDDEHKQFVIDSRKTIENILSSKDDRLMVIVGPCSIHNYDQAIDYANKLKTLQTKNIFIVMRVYFEKPRTCLGWKGFIYDPYLDESNKISDGLVLARKLLIEITKMKIPIGLEFLDTITPQYLADLVSWGAIGARTTESQIHRQLASGLSMPIGFKNLTDGNVDKAVEGMKSSSYPHAFLGIDEDGKTSFIETIGNPFSHIILRGGDSGTNYNEDFLIKLQSKKLSNKIVIDCSHGNSEKNYKRQVLVAMYIRRLHLLKNYNIGGIMIESNINEGNQKIDNITNLKYGVSVTDACINWMDTEYLIKTLDNIQINNDLSDLKSVREIINYYDKCLYTENYDYLPIIVPVQKCYEVDKQINEITNGNIKQNILLSLRLSLSEKVAEIKLQSNTFEFLKKETSTLECITNMDVEKNILKEASYYSKEDLMIKIMELSKWIQVSHVEYMMKNIKIGYLFGLNTCSHEAIEKLYGNHIICSNLEDIYKKIDNKEIDYALIPSYNIKAGIVNNIPINYISCGRLNILIQLSIWTNTKDVSEYEIFYIEPHIDKEVNSTKLKYKNKIYTNNSRQAMLDVINCDKSAFTIASSKPNGMLYKLEDIHDPNNRTYFEFIKLI